MRAVFLADAHLRQRGDPAFQVVVRFLDRLLEGRLPPPAAGDGSEGPPHAVDALYIAGDFFDFWFCKNQNIYPDFRPVIDRLVAIRDRGVQIHLCEGNHDFFMGGYFSDTLGIPVATGDIVTDLEGMRTLISHGDLVDQTNRKYLFLRHLLRSPLACRLQGLLPSALLWKAALVSSRISRGISTQAEDLIADKMQAFALEKFREGLDVVILGHCHKALLQEHELDGRRKVFATLGDWLRHQSYLDYDNGRFRLCHFR